MVPGTEYCGCHRLSSLRHDGKALERQGMCIWYGAQPLGLSVRSLSSYDTQGGRSAPKTRRRDTQTVGDGGHPCPVYLGLQRAWPHRLFHQHWNTAVPQAPEAHSQDVWRPEVAGTTLCMYLIAGSSDQGIDSQEYPSECTQPQRSTGISHEEIWE